MNVIYMGTPEFSIEPLKKIHEKHNILAVVTQPDKKVGNKGISFSSVKKFAIDKNIRVIQPNKIRKEYQEIVNLKPDVIVTCAYGQIIPKELLDAPKYGCINIHASLLPKYRGGAPIHRAIYNGDSETGITIMYMNEKMDEGDIIEMESIPITFSDNLETMHDKLSILGSKMIIDVLKKLEDNEVNSYPQEGEPTYAYNIKREDEKLDFSKTSLEVYNHVRAFNPFPGTYFKIDNTIMKVWEVSIGDDISGEVSTVVDINDKIGIRTKDGVIYLEIIQPEGKKRMPVKDYLNGNGKEVFKVGTKI